MGKPRRRFSDAAKRAAVDDYVAGRKSAAQVAAAHEVSIGQVYKWKVQLDEKVKGEKLDEYEAMSGEEQTKLIRELRAERDVYRQQTGEQAVIIELLKRRLMSTSSQQRSELTGLIETLERAAQKRKRGGS